MSGRACPEPCRSHFADRSHRVFHPSAKRDAGAGQARIAAYVRRITDGDLPSAQHRENPLVIATDSPVPPMPRTSLSGPLRSAVPAHLGWAVVALVLADGVDDLVRHLTQHGQPIGPEDVDEEL